MLNCRFFLHMFLLKYTAREYILSFLRLRHCLCDDSSSANCVFLSGNSSTNQHCISVVLMCRHAFGTNTVKCSRSQFFHITLVFKINTCQALKATTTTNRWHEFKKTLPDTWTVYKTRVFAGCCCARMYQPDFLSHDRIPQGISQYRSSLVLTFKICILHCVDSFLCKITASRIMNDEHD